MLSQTRLLILLIGSMTLCIHADSQDLWINYGPAQSQGTPRQRQQEIVQKFAQQNSAAIQQQQQRVNQPRIDAATSSVLHSSNTSQQKFEFQQRQKNPNPRHK